jgi:hypothetical protein
LRLGFARYALHTINKIQDTMILYRRPDDTCQNSKDYFKLSYVEKLEYIFNTIEPALDNLKKECREINNSENPDCAACAYSKINGPTDDKDNPPFYTCRLEENPIVMTRQSTAYNELNLKYILEKTNAYIHDLTELLNVTVSV